MSVRGNHKISPEELAALLDGEIRDSARAEQLSALIVSDPALKAEYEAQRAAKLALSRLPEAAAPDFMHTRVLGRISIERKVRRSLKLPLLRLAGGAALLFATGIGTGVYFASTNQPGEVAGGYVQAEHIPARGIFASTDANFTSTDSLMQSLAQPDLALPEGQIDSGLADFLQQAYDAHNYSKAMLAAGHKVSPDMPAALALMGEPGQDGLMFASSDSDDDYKNHTVLAQDSH